MATHLLFESSVGYACFAVSFAEDIGRRTQVVQEGLADVQKFASMVSLLSFAPFADASHALENINDCSEGVLHEDLAALLELALPAKRKNVVLGVSERGLAGAIKTALGVECDTSDKTLDLIRGVRLHAEKLIPQLETGDIDKAQLGMAHAYSRAKVKFNVHRSDNMIIQSIALVDQLDKDVNLFAMRVREWYGWHFPELVRIVPDNYQYARAVLALGDKGKHIGGADEETTVKLVEALDGDEPRAQNVFDAARSSMGTDISPIDLINILNFASRVVHLFAYRASLQKYLAEKMSLVAPNLGALIGNTVAARLISHAGSLTNLSKYPASTVQILGAEKALFRALKTKSNTPKYGLIYHSTFIGRAGTKNKGRISRFLANKCSIASRIDCFSDSPSTQFGEALREQVEERLAFYETGSAPTRNAEAMARVLAKIRDNEPIANADDLEDASVAVALEGKPKKSKKRKSDVLAVAAAADLPATDSAVVAATPTLKQKISKGGKIADTPTSALSAARPSIAADDSAMDVDVIGAATDDAKAARKAAKRAAKAAKHAAAEQAVAEELGADKANAPVTAVGEAVATEGALPKKKKRKSVA